MSDARLLLCCFAVALLATSFYGWLNRTDPLETRSGFPYTKASI